MKKNHHSTSNFSNLDKVKEEVNKNIYLLLNSLGIKYEEFSKNIYSCCPIHEGSDNPRALSISKNNGTWKCWTRGCQDDYGKDIFGLVRGVLSKKGAKEVTFSESLKYICNLYKINLLNIKSENSKFVDSDFDIFVSFLKKEHVIDHPFVYNKVETCGFSKYFESRGFSSDTLKYFGVEDCLENKSKLYMRSIIPIHNNDGIQVGYTARAIKDYILPKYIISEGLRKNDYLYNYHRAINKVNVKFSLFIVEGQGDVWRMYESGVENCVGLFGKDISSIQKQKILSMGITDLIVLTDSDQAGRESKIKIQREFSRMLNLHFPKMLRKDIGLMSVEKIRDEILSQVKGLY